MPGPRPNDAAKNDNIKTRFCGDLAELPSLDVLTRQLECPACYEVPLPPIFLCIAGHNVCFSCKSQMDKCPLCKSPFSTTRNFVMEGVISASKFHCNYKHHGCMDLIVGEKFQEHSSNCEYRNGAISNKKPQSHSTKTSSNSTTTNANEQTSNRPTMRRVGGCCQWISSSSDSPIPQDAVEGGFEHGTLLYIARSPKNGGCFPGKLNAQSLRQFFPLGAAGLFSDEYEVLIAAPESVQWVTAVEGAMPANPVIGGRTELGEALYVGRCGHDGTLIVGWVLPCWRSVRAVYNNQVVSSSMFEILVKTELGIALDLSAN